MVKRVSGLLAIVLVGSGVLGCDPPPDRPVDVPERPDQVDDVDGDDHAPLTTVKVLSGPFMMGCNSAVVKPCDSDEMPYHSVVLSSFEIDVVETPQWAYQKCMTAGACSRPERTTHWDPIDLANFPVVGVTWAQAVAYCAWTGRRLPTEAEWERSARGDDGRIWPWGNQVPTCARANFAGCGGRPQPVGDAPDGASPRGALDMGGNALEWVADWYDADAYAGLAGAIDPTGPAAGVARVVRGGGFLSDARSTRTSYRGAFAPDAALEAAGFRCARSVDTMPGVE